MYNTSTYYNLLMGHISTYVVCVSEIYANHLKGVKLWKVLTCSVRFLSNMYIQVLWKLCIQRSADTNLAEIHGEMSELLLDKPMKILVLAIQNLLDAANLNQKFYTILKHVTSYYS